jgi:hypothetical protein
MAFLTVGGPCGFISPVSPPSGAASFRTWDELEASQAAAAAGTIAILAGTGSLPICVTIADGVGGVQVLGVVDFTRGDGTEFSVGGTGAHNIQGLGAQQPSIDATGLDMSLQETSVVQLNFMLLNGHAAHVAALYAYSVPALVNLQAIAAGHEGHYGGVVVDSARYWRARWRGNYPNPPALLSPRSFNECGPSSPTVCYCDLEATRASFNVAAIAAGSWSPGDIATTGLTGDVSISSLVDLSPVNRPVLLYADSQGAAGFNAKVLKLQATGGLL